MTRLKEKAVLIVLLAITWILLTYPVDRPELIVGAILVILVSLLPLGGQYCLSEWNLSPKAFLYGFVYILVFSKTLVLSNLDVAFRVLHPRLPINPGIVRVRTRLKSKLGRLILANSITLTPGTITVETRDEFFYVHWIDVRGENLEERTAKIVWDFERYLEVIFG